MIISERYGVPAIGALVTVLLWVAPIPYGYPPVVGGLIVGSLRKNSAMRGAWAGAIMGIAAFPAVLLITLLLVGDVIPAYAGVQAYADGMAGSGPRNSIFYAVLTYSYTMYILSVGIVISGLTAGVLSHGSKIADTRKGFF